MTSVWRFYALAIVLALSALIAASSKTLPEDEHGHNFSLIDDDGSLDTALINYLFARQMVRRLQSSIDVSDLQRKRSYWKQCAFNAVSCFGRK